MNSRPKSVPDPEVPSRLPSGDGDRPERPNADRWAFAVEGSELGVWDEDLVAGRVFRSDRWRRIVDVPETEDDGSDAVLRFRIHPADLPAREECRARHLAGHSPAFACEFRVRTGPGRFRWVLERGGVMARTPEGVPSRLVGTLTDIDRRKGLEQVLLLETRVLERISRSEATGVVLEEVTAGVEAIFDGASASVLRVEPDDGGFLLRDGAGGRLPIEYRRSVDGMRSGPSAGSCGTAVHRRQTVVVPDLRTDPLWKGFSQLASRHGLVACWSVPVLDTQDVPIATFAVYFREVRTSTPEELEVLDRMAHLVRIALERERSERALRRSEARFETLFRNSPAAIGILTVPEGRVVDVNGRFGALLGFRREELLGRTLRELGVGLGGAERERLISRLVGQRRLLGVEARMRVRDGGLRDVLLDLEMMELAGDASPVLVAQIVDITERKRAEERLAEQATLLDVSRDAVIVRDLEGRVRFWSRGAERLHGIPASGAVGRPLLELLEPEPEQFLRAEMAVRESGVWNGPLNCEAAGRETLSLDSRWTLLRDPSGEPRSILTVDTDVTERKKLERQFLRAQRMESIGTLAGGIAHDLNNVLAPILMSIELLRLELDAAERNEILDTISAAARRGADMVGQVLSFARGVEGRRIVLQVRHLLRDVAKIAAETFPRSIRIESRIPSELATVIGDPTQVHQVLLNLCVNARDAMPGGGTLTLTARDFVADAQYAGLNPEAQVGPYVVIEVEDSGTGMPAQVLEQIFDPFFTTKEPGKGTGLGLSTSLAIVRSHGGFFRVYSEPGKGSRFQVHLPATQETAIPENPAPPELPRGNGELILVVDDEVSVRQVTTQTLEAFGYRTVASADGAEAVSLFAHRGPEIALVLTDMMMPVMDGPATIQVLLRMSPSVRIIAASGLNLNEYVARAAGAGIRHFLPKPYTAEALLGAIHEVLGPERAAGPGAMGGEGI